LTGGVRLTLVLGGIRSGKSAIAVKLAADSGLPVTVVATGLPSDPEMKARIAAHQAARPKDWTVVEEPLQPQRAVASVARGTVLLDSIDSWVGNLMPGGGSPGGDRDPESTSELPERIEGSLKQLIETAASGQLTLIVVSSEVGLGLIATTPQGRAFTDLLGRANQGLAASAERVLLAMAGLTHELKPEPGPRSHALTREEVPR
jgi:adenosylcobinamide kinase/adenosylcobinamide-phosphate guanylyltransferase